MLFDCFNFSLKKEKDTSLSLSLMALEGRAPQNPEKVYTDVLSEARQACYKVLSHYFSVTVYLRGYLYFYLYTFLK